MQAETLNFVLPCSFQLQIMHRESPTGEIEEIPITVGEQRDDENQSKRGESATQQTTVYPITQGNRTVRLIDTPGIGDTRGISYDEKNMNDILATLGNYDILHGILILMKPNSPRLTTTIRWCLKELLTHLHRSATVNIAFAFTNTRISHYTPGDTYTPLKALLEEHKDTEMRLSSLTTYCFDSESFRYLAALKCGHRLPNEEDFRRSWEHSREETQRLLDYFSTRRPHHVKSTLSLNGTRILIQELTKPMANIARIIQSNIDATGDKITELQHTRDEGNELSKRLLINKTCLRTKRLDKPRTVCAEAVCMSVQDDGSGLGRVVSDYHTNCHAPCHLNDVTAEQVGFPGLVYCNAFRGQQNCTHCTHHWMTHLHVLYELEEYTIDVNDETIEKLILSKATEAEKKEAAITRHKKLAAEYQGELDQIQEAAAYFCLFLRRNAITPINDATLEYLQILIKNEEGKIAAGEAGGLLVDENRRTLQALRNDRERHLQLLAALKASMGNDSDGQSQALTEAEVSKAVQRLYALPRFGEMLKDVKDDIASAHQATYRERPYRVDKSRRSGGAGGCRTGNSSMPDGGRSAGHGYLREDSGPLSASRDGANATWAQVAHQGHVRSQTHLPHPPRRSSGFSFMKLRSRFGWGAA